MRHLLWPIVIIRWCFYAIQFKITKDYGMCCCEERAREAAWENLCRWYGLWKE